MAHETFDSDKKASNRTQACGRCGAPIAEPVASNQVVCSRCVAKANRRAIVILGILILGCLFLLFGVPLVSRILANAVPVGLLYPLAAIMLLLGIGFSLVNCWRGTASQTEQRAAYMGCLMIVAVAFNFLQHFQRTPPDPVVLDQADQDRVAPLQLIRTPGTYINKSGHILKISVDPADGVEFRLSLRDMETEWACAGEWLLTWDEKDKLWFADMEGGISRISIGESGFVSRDCSDGGECSDIPETLLRQLPEWFIEAFGATSRQPVEQPE